MGRLNIRLDTAEETFSLQNRTEVTAQHTIEGTKI